MPAQASKEVMHDQLIVNAVKLLADQFKKDSSFVHPSNSILNTVW